MILFENDNGYKKACVWQDEMPFNCTGTGTMHLCKEAGNINWKAGTICIEARLNARHISNYAMVFMRYTNNQKNKTDIIINYGNENIDFKSYVQPFNKTICAGLDKEFAGAVYRFFEGYPIGGLPGGTIEILGGGYDEVGSSENSFKKVMEILVIIFNNTGRLADKKFQYKLLNFM